jgi:hypothetical protein
MLHPGPMLSLHSKLRHQPRCLCALPLGAGHTSLPLSISLPTLQACLQNVPHRPFTRKKYLIIWAQTPHQPQTAAWLDPPPLCRSH